MKGVAYLVESRFVFKPGIQHTITVVISKNPEQVKIEIGGEIEDHLSFFPIDSRWAFPLWKKPFLPSYLYLLRLNTFCGAM